MIRSLKQNKKGFTLVELLAVIVILAVLIVIAMPSVLKIMENARRSAFETEVKSYLKAAQTQYATNLAGNATGGASSTNTFTNAKESDGDDAGTPLNTIENKSGYYYNITVTPNTSDGSVSYTYTICNSEFGAQTSDGVSINANVNSQKTQKCEGNKGSLTFVAESE